MSTYKIYPLCYGRTVRPGPGDTPILGFYVTDGTRKILVDTGGAPADGTYRAPYYQAEDQFPDKQLALLGVDPAEIEIVILTHLHWDHASNNHLFPNAVFYVQKEELHYAVTPVPIHAPGYELLTIFRNKYEVLDGDEQILDGISVILTPSHTSGSQCVLVNTDKGVCALTGDFITQYEQWESNPRIAGNIHTDLIAYYRSRRQTSNW